MDSEADRVDCFVELHEDVDFVGHEDFVVREDSVVHEDSVAHVDFEEDRVIAEAYAIQWVAYEHLEVVDEALVTNVLDHEEGHGDPEYETSCMGYEVMAMVLDSAMVAP